MAERRGNRLLVDRIDTLRKAFIDVKRKHPFKVDADFSIRWGLIKAYFSRQIAKEERVSKSREKRGGRGLWQHRFWEHLVRDETDYQQHIDYIHWNPVKHGWVQYVKDWPHSSFHRYVECGIYAENWGNGIDLLRLSAGE